MSSQNKMIRKVKGRIRRRQLRRGLILLPVILIALTVLLISMFVPVLQIFGSSMSPALNNQDTVAVIGHSEYAQGDIIAFYCQDQILTRRVIAGPGSTVDIDGSGNVTVDGILLSEHYVSNKEQGVCTTQFPCTVPEGHYFVLGDRRNTSVDSRSTLVGCVAQQDIIGRVFWILLPKDSFGAVQ